MATRTRTTETHVRQRFALKVLNYYVGDKHPNGRMTDPTTTITGRIGMSERQAQQRKQIIRDMILIAADNIRAGRE